MNGKQIAIDRGESSDDGEMAGVPRTVSAERVSTVNSYVSSESSAATATAERRTTIDHPSSKGQPIGSQSFLPFYPSYDSEESDGSVVYNYSRGAGVPQSATNHDSSPHPITALRHDRLPSFDGSVGSTGSFKVLPSAASITSHSQVPVPVNSAPSGQQKPPAILPYDQRQRRKQQMEEQRQEEQVPVQPQMNTQQPYYHPQQQRQSNPHHMGDPYARLPPQFVAVHPSYPPPPSFPIPPQMQHPQMMPIYYDQQYVHQAPQPFQPPSYPMVVMPPQHQMHHQLPPQQGGYNRSEAMKKLGPAAAQQQSRHASRIYAGQRPRASSLDSSSLEQDRHQRPPPPPPPPVGVTNHYREDSMGSVSSLGSSGGGYAKSPTGKSRRERSAAETSGHAFVSGIMDMLSPQLNLRPRSKSGEGPRQQNQLQQQSNNQSSRHSGRPDKLHRPRSGHQRLPSIENDEWGESLHEGPSRSPKSNTDDMLSESDQSSVPDEKTSLLPPSGISTREQSEEPRRSSREHDSKPRSSSRYLSERSTDQMLSEEPTTRFDNRSSAFSSEINTRSKKGKRRKGKRKDEKRRSRRSRQLAGAADEEASSEQSDDSSEEVLDQRKWQKRKARLLAKERARMIEQWKQEARELDSREQASATEHSWYGRAHHYFEQLFVRSTEKVLHMLAMAEIFISNLPLTIGAIALAIATLGVVWFKYAEENLDSCEPVHFHSSQCTFPEFPGCFYCDTTSRTYRIAVNFHFACSAIAGVLAMAVILKAILARKVFLDEMNSPTTASPAGLLCMTLVCVFAGRGVVGQIIVICAASLHLALAMWFMYCALAYKILPEPSWYPNSVGIGLSAVKAWLYYPTWGHILMAISLTLNFVFFPISLFRVTVNRKISATVSWIQMSAPAVSLYAMTIMAQPSFEEEHPDVTKFERVHRRIYLPCMHILFALAILGVMSSVQSLVTRWKEFRQLEFSPAHAAFCFPTLAHANAIQAYRAAINSFSDIAPGTPFKLVIYVYWVTVLVFGTIGTIYITLKFFYNLPKWTQIDVEGEETPPAPYETSLTLSHALCTGEMMMMKQQPYVSPAVLQANETGALVMLPRGRGGGHRFVRTRRLAALGFEPTMSRNELNRERDILLDYAAKNPPRRRRTRASLGIPGVDFNNFRQPRVSGVYGSMTADDDAHDQEAYSTP